MPRGGSHGRGKKSHKGGTRHFTTPAELEQQEEKMRKEKEWRKQKGYASESEEEEGDGDGAAPKPESHGAPGELPPSGSESEEEEEEDSDEEGEAKAKGVEHLIEIENPNRVKQKTKKVTALGEDATPAQLSRKEREEIERQEARQRYQQLHAAGKTDEARADLARLAIIRKQREDAAKKKEEERKAREEAAAATKQKS